MAKLSRREFTKLSGAVVAGTTTARWPLALDTRAYAQEPAGGLTAFSLSEASARIHDRSVTSTQLTNALLERIAIYNPKINCFITVMREEALRQAAQLDVEQAAGKFRGPLHGIPIGLKDNIDTAGVRTTAASGVFQTRVPTEDADIVRRLKEAGAVVVGKLNLHEFAMGCTGDVSFFGPTRNPWALDHVTGGSSAGSGASVAAELCYGALGTDTAGSIRAPSAWCGVVGIKPTTGLVSIRGIVPCAASLDHCGPMARRVEDVALMLNSMAGYDNLDIFSVEHPKEDYVAALKQPVSSFRLGRPPEFYDHLDPEVASAVATAIEVLSKLTAGVTSHKSLPEVPAGRGFFVELGDAASYHQELLKDSRSAYMPPTRRSLEPLVEQTAATAVDSARAHDKLTLLRRTVDAAFVDKDLVVMPTAIGLPPKINESLADEMGNQKPVVYDFFSFAGCVNSAPFDVYGIPALSLPCGFSKSGLPIGLMIAGPHFAEGKVLALAYAYQQATHWHEQKPALNPATVVPPVVEIVPPATPPV